MFLYGNMRGLVLSSNRAKIQQMEDLVNLNNGLGFSVTETWLNDEIMDAEISMENLTVFRGVRICGTRFDVQHINQVNVNQKYRKHYYFHFMSYIKDSCSIHNEGRKNPRE